MSRISFIILFVMLGWATCFGQSSFKGLTPGRSTRADVERVLGQPVKEVSETLIEYPPQRLTGKIFVQYRKGSPVVERIEMVCRLETSTCEDLIKSLNLRLPKNPASDQVGDEKWKSLYGPPLFIVTSGVMADAAGDSLPPSRVAFYSRELYEAYQATLPASNSRANSNIEKVTLWEPINLQSSLHGQTLVFYAGTTPEKCQSDCGANARYKAFTYIRAGAYQPTDPPMCYLIAEVTGSATSSCCISAIKK
ncbi:hypothetical protein BH20ACI3_BH20ACI3_38100 [soil metagenome]